MTKPLPLSPKKCWSGSRFRTDHNQKSNRNSAPPCNGLRSTRHVRLASDRFGPTVTTGRKAIARGKTHSAVSLGVRTHSAHGLDQGGWANYVVLGGPVSAPNILLRGRMQLCD